MNAEDMSAPSAKLIVTDGMISDHTMRKIFMSNTLAKRAAADKNQTMFDNTLVTMCECFDTLDPSNDSFYSTVQSNVTSLFQYSSFNHMPIQYQNVSGRHFFVWTCFDSAFNLLHRLGNMSSVNLLAWKRRYLQAAEEVCSEDTKKTALTNIRKEIANLGGYCE